MLEFITIFISVISLLISLFTLFSSLKEMKIGHKQFLFEKRLESLEFIKDIFSLYEENAKFLAIISPMTPEVQFCFLTNRGSIEEMCNVFSDINDIEKKKKYLLKKEDFYREINILKFIWCLNKEDLSILESFLTAYISILDGLYKHFLYKESISNSQEKFPKELRKMSNDIVNELQENMQELNIFENIRVAGKNFQEIQENQILDKLETALYLK